jgi:uncharacterized protein YyaL (SSP411 family)
MMEWLPLAWPSDSTLEARLKHTQSTIVVQNILIPTCIMPNRLAQSPSLYLRKHAENPIDWWFWCDAALETARRENKPIFLSIGYSSCHWCTVMEGEAFSDPSIAEYLNANFVPIKVDREERPDLDSIYMQSLQMMTGQGGWPLNIFLAPDDLVPFYAGTYFPLEPKYGRPGFLQVLQALRRFYDEEKPKLSNVKAEILGNLQRSVLLNPTPTVEPEVLNQGFAASTSILAGVGMGPSFPMIPYADATLRASRFALDSPYDAHETALQRGLDLALGGIFDHVAGGFHRYTVDSTWTVPHFEKMLYDNGQIMEYLANLWSTGAQEPAFERAIDLTVQWLQREMTAPEGYFYAAQDADSFQTATEVEPEEGAFYVWRYADLAQYLTAAELGELEQTFTITAAGNFEGCNVLQRQQPGPLSPAVEIALAKLFAVRYGMPPDMLSPFPPARTNADAKQYPWPGRIPPVTDTKMIVAWNGLMISGLARAAMVWGRRDCWQLASRAAQFILEHQRVQDRLHRLHYDGQTAVLAQSEDYALLIKALLDLHQATLVLDLADADRWLTAALQLQQEFDTYLWSPELGGYYNTANDSSRDLLVRERNYMDNATPSANGVAIANLVRLSLLTDIMAYLDRSEQALQAFGSVLETMPQACPSLFGALDWFEHPVRVQTQGAGLALPAQHYWPTTLVLPSAELPEGAIGMVCQGLSCLEPVMAIEQLIGEVQLLNFPLGPGCQPRPH